MAEAPPSRISKTQKTNELITESDMEAAQQLIQLSDEDSSNNTSGKRNRRRRDEEVDQRLSDITTAKIREIFGEDEVFQPKKQRRYRSLVNIYMATRPINA